MTVIAVPKAAAPTTEPPDRPTPVRYLVLASACSLAVITYLHRVGFATASAEFKNSLGLTDNDLGWLMAAFMIGYGIFEMPWGFLGDRFGVRHTVAVIVLGGSTLTALLVLVAFLPPQPLLIVGFLVLLRFLFGAFQAGTFPSIARMMADWMPSTERGAAQGAIWMSSRIGGALAPLLLVWLFVSLGRLEVAARAPGSPGHSLVRILLAMVSQPARRDARRQRCRASTDPCRRRRALRNIRILRYPGEGWRPRRASGLSA